MFNHEGTYFFFLLPNPFSVPFHNRTILARCLTITKIETNQLKMNTPVSTDPGNELLGKIKPTVARIPNKEQAPILPTETYLVVTVSSTQKLKQVMAKTGCNARKTPIAVSTPLPPRKPAKQVKLWPRMANKPAAKGNQGCTPASTHAVRNGAKKPLPRSTKTTGRAGFHPNTRNTLVSPAFLLPCSRMSIFFQAFATQTAVGIEPSR